MSSFTIAANAVLPFVLYLSFGYLIRRTGIADEPFLRKLNTLVFRAFFPLMMFDNIYSLPSGTSLSSKVLLFAFAGEVLLLAVTLPVVMRLAKNVTRIAVLTQAIYRSNILLFAIPLARHLYGEEALGYATALVVFIVPFYNASGVVLFEVFSGRKNSSLLMLLKNVLTNPLIAGLLAALPFRFLNLSLPDPLYNVIHQYSAASTPIALFILGGTLRFSSLWKNRFSLTAVFVVKLLLVPALMLYLSTMFGFSAMERFVVFTLYATPIATATYSMAQGMGADYELCGEAIVVTTVGSVFTLFFWICFLQGLGMM